MLAMFAGAFGTFKALPKWVKIAIGLTLVVAAAILWLTLHDRGVRKAAVSRDRAESSVEALDTARGADEAAEAATAGKSQEVEDGNDRARAAAEAGSDPLGDAMRSLRAKTHGTD